MRRSGKTTRIIDRLVQEYFEKGICYVYEERNNNNISNRSLWTLFKNRIFIEHGHEAFVEWGKFDDINCGKVVNLHYRAKADVT